MLLTFIKTSFAQEKSRLLSNINVSGRTTGSIGFMQNNLYGQSGAFANFQFVETISAYDIPVNFIWNATRLPNGNVQFNCFNISFSRNEMLQRLSAREDSISKLKNFNDQKIDSLTKILSDPEYLQLISIAKMYLAKYKIDSARYASKIVDSLNVSEDSLNTNDFRDSLRKVDYSVDTNQLRSCRNSVAEFEELKENYFNEVEIKKARLKEQKELNDSIITKAKSVGAIRKRSHKILSNFETINIGVQSTNESWLTLYNYNFNGIKLKYSDGKIIAGFTSGINRRISFDNLSVGSFNNVILENEKGRNFYSLSAGIGRPGNNTILSFTKFDNDVKELDPARASQVSLVSLNIEKEIVKGVDAVGVIAKNIKDDQQGNERDYSASVELNTHVKQLNCDIRAKYLVIGRDYFTPGNLYLTTGYTAMSGEVQKMFFVDKLKLNFKFENAISTSWKRNSILVNSNLKVSSKIKLGIKYGVNNYLVYTQEDGFTNVSNFYQISVGYQISKKSDFKTLYSKNYSKSATGLNSINENYGCVFQYKAKSSVIQIQENIYKNDYGIEKRLGSTTSVMHSFRLKKISFNERLSINNIGVQNTIVTSIGANWSQSKNLSVGFSGSRNDFLSAGEFINYNSSYQVQMNITLSY